MVTVMGKVKVMARVRGMVRVMVRVRVIVMVMVRVKVMVMVKVRVIVKVMGKVMGRVGKAIERYSRYYTTYNVNAIINYDDNSRMVHSR
jgi:hypothetical protein